MHPSSRTLLTVFLAALLLTSTSCSRSAARPQPVRGQVLYRGGPVVEALVVFHPHHGQYAGRKPLAYTDSQGRFSLTTLKADDGAVPGSYTITVELRERVLVGEDWTRDGRHLLPTFYSRPESSGLRHEVT